MISDVLPINILNPLNTVPVPTVLCRINSEKDTVKILFQNKAFISLASSLMLHSGNKKFSFLLFSQTLTTSFLTIQCKKSMELQKPVLFNKQCKLLGTWYKFSIEANQMELFSLSIVEITDIKQNEIQLRSESIINRKYFDSIPCGIAVFNQDTQFLQANEFVCSILGYPEKILKTMTLFDLNPSQYISDIVSFFKILQIQGSKDSVISVLTKSGKRLTLQLNGKLLPDGTNLIIWTDITQLSKRKIKPEVSLLYTQNLNLYHTIANLTELRDTDTGHHNKRIGVFSRIIARTMGMNRKFCDDIEIFAQLHDIGKIGIQDSILLAPRRLTEEERTTMEKHTLLGYNIVKENVELSMAADITLNHHERFDGSGYPNGIYGYEIPLSAQITSVGDVYDALRSKRPYKQGWAHKDCIEYISSLSGKNFNPEIVDVFLSVQNKVDNVYTTLSD